MFTDRVLKVNLLAESVQETLRDENETNNQGMLFSVAQQKIIQQSLADVFLWNFPRKFRSRLRGGTVNKSTGQ